MHMQNPGVTFAMIFFLIFQENKRMRRQLHISRPNLKPRIKVQRKKSIVIKHAPRIQIISSLCLMQSPTWLLLTTCEAVAYIKPDWQIMWHLLILSCNVNNLSTWHWPWPDLTGTSSVTPLCAVCNVSITSLTMWHGLCCSFMVRKKKSNFAMDLKEQTAVQWGNGLSEFKDI